MNKNKLKKAKIYWLIFAICVILQYISFLYDIDIFIHILLGIVIGNGIGYNVYD